MKPRFYSLVLLKKFFDNGYAITSPVKYALAVFFGANAIITEDLSSLVIVGLLYGLSCFVVGLLWYKFGFELAQREVDNQYDILSKQLRKFMKKT